MYWEKFIYMQKNGIKKIYGKEKNIIKEIM
jgi:hypothetical protein